MDWREVAVTVAPEGEEAVADLFYQLGCPGVSIEDPVLLQQYIQSGFWDYHIFGEVILTGTSVVKGYLPENEELQCKLKQLDEGLQQLMRQLPDGVVQVKGLTVQEEDWATAWKAYFKPVRVGRHLLIKPSWEPVEPEVGDILIELDPGMAFGTGTHPTTTLCMQALEETVKPGMRVIDLGTGSGILAIVAAKLGAEVEAVDLDAVAVKAAQENVDLNGVTNRIQVKRGDLGTVISGVADLVVANIIADVIILLLEDLPRLLACNGQFIASGIIGQRAFEVEQAMHQAGMQVLERKEEGGWVMLKAKWRESSGC